MELGSEELKEFMDKRVDEFNNPYFIEHDPIQIPHLFSKKEDIEIAGFLAATISWGNRKMIVRNAKRLMELLGCSPYDFIMNHKEKDLQRLEGFVHRTFNSTDLIVFIESLKFVYQSAGGLETIFNEHKTMDSLQPAIHQLRNIFFYPPHPHRTEKHLPDPFKGSAAKRINMFLRWMVRNDGKGVDFGIWKEISPSLLSCPLDIHSGNIARKLGLLTRKQNDAKAVKELDNALRQFDPDDPVKYDFALFGLGISGHFNNL